jgi:hypothetical protein
LGNGPKKNSPTPAKESSITTYPLPGLLEKYTHILLRLPPFQRKGNIVFYPLSLYILRVV